MVSEFLQREVLSVHLFERVHLPHLFYLLEQIGFQRLALLMLELLGLLADLRVSVKERLADEQRMGVEVQLVRVTQQKKLLHNGVDLEFLGVVEGLLVLESKLSLNLVHDGGACLLR